MSAELDRQFLDARERMDSPAVVVVPVVFISSLTGYLTNREKTSSVQIFTASHEEVNRVNRIIVEKVLQTCSAYRMCRLQAQKQAASQMVSVQKFHEAFAIYECIAKDVYYKQKNASASCKLHPDLERLLLACISNASACAIELEMHRVAHSLCLFGLARLSAYEHPQLCKRLAERRDQADRKLKLQHFDHYGLKIHWGGTTSSMSIQGAFTGKDSVRKVPVAFTLEEKLRLPAELNLTSEQIDLWLVVQVVGGSPADWADTDMGEIQIIIQTNITEFELLLAHLENGCFPAGLSTSHNGIEFVAARWERVCEVLEISTTNARGAVNARLQCAVEERRAVFCQLTRPALDEAQRAHHQVLLEAARARAAARLSGVNDWLPTSLQKPKHHHRPAKGRSSNTHTNKRSGDQSGARQPASNETAAAPELEVRTHHRIVHCIATS